MIGSAAYPRLLVTRATALVAGRAATGNLQPSDGVGEFLGYYDEWTYSAVAGQRVVITMDSEDVDAYLVVLQDDGTEVASGDDGGTDYNARVEFRAPATEQYTILAASLFFETTGRYVIRAEAGPGAVGMTSSDHLAPQTLSPHANQTRQETDMAKMPVPNTPDTSRPDQQPESPRESKLPRIGLALSGGGFRASLFHLGVIRRLEELGIMKHIDTISAVSGGSILATYYVIEMEKRLRRHGANLRNQSDIAETRLKIFEEIAECFYRALDQNIRSRATLFSPFYHPILWLRSWWPTYSRSDIIQREYDKWLYFNDTLDHLPVFSSEDHSAQPDNVLPCKGGPKVILNATSLLTGKRREFTRQPVSGLDELHRINRNVLKLSRVVGASSGVPGVFPPTAISGDMLVDGGVSDNQGIDALINVDRVLDRVLRGAGAEPAERSDGDEASTSDLDEFDVLLVSDASGQMELKHSVRKRALGVVLRTASVYQYQLRKKMIKILRLWRGAGTGARRFAFVHLSLNLKDRCIKDRVPSEYIPALGRIRTDLDQFSHIEREALMYHGYTLIDAQLRQYCKRLWQCCGGKMKLRRPPLFVGRADKNDVERECDSAIPLRRRVKEVLTTGSHALFLLRSRSKYPRRSWWVFAPSLAVYGGGLGAVRWQWEALYRVIAPPVEGLRGMVPVWVGQLGKWLFENACLFLDSQVLTVLVGWGLWSYIMLFATFESMRRAVCRWDRKDYEKLAEQKPSVRWSEN